VGVSEPRLIGEHFRSDGRPKRGFPNRAAAERFLERTGGRGRFGIYCCSFCSRWHLASI
jgi:hypothetical protein